VAGIVRYGSYVPYFRLNRKALGGAGERAVASYDENSVSMAVEAARQVLDGPATEGGNGHHHPLPVDRILLGTTTPGYAEKLDAATLHAALDLPRNIGAAVLGGSTRVGLSALQLGLDLAAAGRRPLLTLADVVMGAPGGTRESAGGDGAVAFALGPDDEAIARILGSGSTTDEFLDVWRAPGEPFARQWEERFGAELLAPLMAEALQQAMASAGVRPDTLWRIVVDSTNPRASRALLAQLGAPKDHIADDLASWVGRTGAAHAGLMLANLLDQAHPGARIAVVTGADGADAMILEVTDKIAAGRPRRSVKQWIEAKRADLQYMTYLKWRGVMPFEKPRRPDPKRPAAPPSHRAERWKFGFVGSRCKSCGAANLPPQRVCVMCDAIDQMEPEPFASSQATVATYTQDRLAYSMQPPVVVAILDFDQGGRFSCQLTDVDPQAIKIGDRVEMTFRLLHTADGILNYFWKARPLR
jgi:3-hydroxy-3-methylglutaryl CoA synthase